MRCGFKLPRIAVLHLPGQQDGPIGFLMYPYAETTQGRKDSLDPDAFAYRITSQQIA